MSGDLFSLWTRDEIVTEIRHLEEQLVLNVQHVSYSGGGAVGNGTPDNARKVLRSLYARLHGIDGTSRRTAGPRSWVTTWRSGF